MLQLTQIVKTFHNQQSYIAEAHRLQVEVAHHKRREIETRHIIEELVGIHRIAREDKHKILRLVGITLEIGRLSVGCHRHRIIGKTHRPHHPPRIALRRIGHTSGLQTRKDSPRHVGHVGVGPFAQKFGETLLELIVVLFGEIGKGIDEYKFRKNLREGITLLHISCDAMHSRIVIIEISIVGFLIFLLLNGIHAAEILEIIGVEHSLTIGGIGEFRDDLRSPPLSLRHIILTHSHDIHVVIHIQAIDIIGVSLIQAHELLPRRREILKLVFKNHTFII